MQEKLFVCGTLIVPVYFPVHSTNNEQALSQVSKLLSRRTISVLDGDIHTWNGRSYPIIANRCRIEWTDVVAEQDII